MSTAITTPRPVDRTESHTATFATRWLQPSVAVITAHGELDASNAQELVDYALRDADRTERLALDLTGVDFFGTAGFSALHTLNVRCAGAGVEWVHGAQQCGQPTDADLRSGFDSADRRHHARRAGACFRPTSAGYCSWSRSRVRDFASSRDTCICEMPTRSAICVWVSDSKNLSTSTVRSRSGQRFQQGPQRFSVLDLIQAQIDVAQRVGDRRRILVAAAATAVDRQRVVGAACHQALDDLVAVHVRVRRQAPSGSAHGPAAATGRRSPRRAAGAAP